MGPIARFGIRQRHVCTHPKLRSPGRLVSMPNQHSAQRGRPVASSVPCAQCQTAVDPIRAPRVSAYEMDFRYFCSVECQQAYVDRDAKSAERAAKSELDTNGKFDSVSTTQQHSDYP